MGWIGQMATGQSDEGIVGQGDDGYQTAFGRFIRGGRRHDKA
jgi:hypothetical protein